MRGPGSWWRCGNVGCKKLAMVQLYNGRNAPMGRYCQDHGERALASHRREYESDG